MVLRALNLYVMIKFYFISYFHEYVFFFFPSLNIHGAAVSTRWCIQMCDPHPFTLIFWGFFFSSFAAT